MRRARRLLRRRPRAESTRFLVEGPQALREALRTPGLVLEILASGDAAARNPDIHGAAVRQDTGWYQVDDAGMGRLSGTVHPQGLVGVCRFLDRTLDGVLAESPRLVVVCAQVRDPGNAGTVIRCADAAGADAVILAGDSVDAYNGKTVRASAGSLFHLPLVVHPDPATAVDTLRRHGLQVLVADGAGETDLGDARDSGLLAAPTAWLFGNEARGVAAGLPAPGDRRVRIPVYGRAESLNLASAAAVCLYESARAQRSS